MQDRIIGITKELRENEEIVRSYPATEVLFLKQEASTKMMGWEKVERIISMARAIIYLTNERVIFLKLFEVPGVSSGQKKNLLAASAGSFFDLSLHDVSYVMKRSLTISKENIFRFSTTLGGDEHQVSGGPALEIGYNERKVSVKKDVVPLYEIVLVLGEPQFTMESIIKEQLKIGGGTKT